MTHVRFITIIFIIFSIFTQRERNTHTHTHEIYGKLKQVIWWIQCARHDEPNSPTVTKSSIRMMNYYFKSQTELLIQPHVCAHCGTTNHYLFFLHLLISLVTNESLSKLFLCYFNGIFFYRYFALYWNAEICYSVDCIDQYIRFGSANCCVFVIIMDKLNSLKNTPSFKYTF